MGLTKAELDFYTRVPSLLADLVRELEKLNKTLEKLNDKKEEENV